MSNKIDGWVAGLKTIESWGVENIYGIPAGSLNSLMDALEKEKKNINFIQVRHEEAGALAASMHAKFTGKIGVCVGSAGPGATHLYNGLYDAKFDNVPVLAILGQRPLSEANMDMFQEMNQNPLFADVAIYNRKVAYAEQLPKVLDEAIRTAVAYRGVAVVEVPVNFGWEKIDADKWPSSASSYRKLPKMLPDVSDIDKAVALLEKAKRPVIYAGKGTRGCGELVESLGRKIKAPIAITGINFDNFNYDYEGLLGSAFRVAWKPANEALAEADTVLFVGSNFPFSEEKGTFSNVKHFIQIDNNQKNLGKRHHPDVTILGDAEIALSKINEKIAEAPLTEWYQANLDNIKNWKEYMHQLEKNTEGDLRLYQVYDAINRYADEDALYSVDVGDVTQTSIRHLHMTPKNTWRTSELFATMGNGLPGAIAAKLEFKNRQVWSLSGDGGFAMNMQDIVTAVRYNLPSIHVVFSNQQFGFIRDSQLDTNDAIFGVDLTDVDFAKIAEAQGAVGYTLKTIEEIDNVFSKAIEDLNAGRVVLIDAKIMDERPIPVENLILDKELYSETEINDFKALYNGENLVTLKELLNA